MREYTTKRFKTNRFILVYTFTIICIYFSIDNIFSFIIYYQKTNSSYVFTTLFRKRIKRYNGKSMGKYGRFENIDTCIPIYLKSCGYITTINGSRRELNKKA